MQGTDVYTLPPSDMRPKKKRKNSETSKKGY